MRRLAEREGRLVSVRARGCWPTAAESAHPSVRSSGASPGAGAGGAARGRGTSVSTRRGLRNRPSRWYSMAWCRPQGAPQLDVVVKRVQASPGLRDNMGITVGAPGRNKGVGNSAVDARATRLSWIGGPEAGWEDESKTQRSGVQGLLGLYTWTSRVGVRGEM